MAITGVHHSSISVTNLGRTVEFYTRLLGAEVQFTKQNKTGLILQIAVPAAP